jgi:hypothetical protein
MSPSEIEGEADDLLGDTHGPNDGQGPDSEACNDASRIHGVQIGPPKDLIY